MKIWKILVNGALGFLLLGAILLTENERYAFFSQIQNPFTKSQDIKNISKNKNSEVQEVFTKNGEFFQIYPNAKLNFSETDRNLISGEFFISSEFVDQKKDKSNLINEAFDPKNFKFGPSRFRVNDIYFDISRASVFIIRDPQKKTTNIYAINHSIDLFFPEVKEPFTIPAEMQVSISDFQINNKIHKIYYSKLKKEFELKPFLLSTKIREESKGDTLSIEEKIVKSLTQKEKKRALIKDFAQKEPRTWVWFEVKNLIGNFSQILKKAQANLAVGYSIKRKNEQTFKNLIIPFVQASIAVEENKPEEARKHLEVFKKNYKSAEWLRLENKTDFSKEWGNLVLAQKAWTQTIFPENSAYVFFEFWNPEVDLNSFEVLEKKFDKIELLLSNYRYKKAESVLLEIKSGLQLISIEEKNSTSLTKMRRVFHEIIKTKKTLQKVEFFELYYELIRSEIKVYQQSQGKQEEIRLEIAQDIMPFLKDKENLDAKKVEVLGRIFIILKLDEIIKKREVNSTIKDDIAIIHEIVQSGGNRELAEKIKESQNAFNESRSIRCQRLGNCEDKNSIIKPIKSNKIESEEKLKKWFKASGFNTEKLLTKKTETYILFRNLKKEKYNISGSFHVKNQNFVKVKIHKSNREKINLKFFKNVVLSVIQEAKKEEQLKNKLENKKLPNQNNPIAIRRKNEIKDYFKALDFDLPISQITAIEINYNEFEIKDAGYQNSVKISGIYLLREDKVKDITIQLGKKPLIEVEITATRSELPALVQRKVFDIFGINLDI